MALSLSYTVLHSHVVALYVNYCSFYYIILHFESVMTFYQLLLFLSVMALLGCSMSCVSYLSSYQL